MYNIKITIYTYYSLKMTHLKTFYSSNKTSKPV